MFAFGLLFFVAGLLIVITTLTVLQCVVDWMRWLTTFLGRAFTYLWIGLIFMWPNYHGYGLRYITSIFLLGVAGLYLVLRFAFNMGDAKCMYVQAPGGFRRQQKGRAHRSSFAYQDNPRRKKKKKQQTVTAYSSHTRAAPGGRGGRKGWKKTKDANTGKAYWYNVRTNETSWTRPY